MQSAGCVADNQRFLSGRVSVIKPTMKPWYLLLLASIHLVLPCAAQQIPVNSSIGYDAANPSNTIVLTWESIPTKLYNVLTTTALGQQPWQTLNASPIYSSNNLVRYRDTNNQPARFYKVVKLDTDPPEIWRLNPGSNATAVARQNVLKAYLRDETAIDPASIILTVGTNPPATLADARLAFTNNILTYTPATNQFLGSNGQTITNTLIVADTLGHRATNSWPLKLELTPILASNVILISDASPLTLVSTNGDTYVFSYTGDSSGLTNGHILVSTDANNPYKRNVLSLTDNPGAHTVSLVTTQAALADILLQGTVRFTGDKFVPDFSGITAASDTDGITIDLGGQTLYDANNVTIQTVSGRLFFDPDFSVSAELSNPRTFDLDVTASMAFDLTLQASWQNTWPFSGEKRIGQPLRQFRLLGFIPTLIPIPIWSEAVWEFYVGTEGEVAAQASVTAGFQSTADLAFGARLRNGQWTPYSSENTRAVPYPVAWQGGGSGRIRGYVEPRLTVYLESLIGPTANVRPYLEVEANACVQPGQAGVDVALYRGINGNLALDIRGWDEDWRELPSWEVFNARSVNPLWHDQFTASFDNLDGLVAKYAFDGDANDSSGNGLNGVPYGAQFETGHLRQGLSVTGTAGSFVEVQHNSILAPTDAVTVSLWVKARSFQNSFSCLLYKAAAPPTASGFQDREYTIWIRSDGGIHFTSTPQGSLGQIVCDSPAGGIQLNKFFHVVGVVDATRQMMKIFINGNLAASTSYPTSGMRTGDFPLRLGGPFFTLGDQSGLDGILDEVRIFNRALALSEIRSLFANNIRQNVSDMVWIPCGTFTMGSPDGEPGRQLREGPQTRVTISQGFWMGKHEVTQGEYQAVMGNNPSYFTGDLSRPVEQVTWFDCVAYCAALTARERNAGRLPAGYVYRLPTEAEWEYACRAGTTTAFYFGKALRSGMANFNGNYEYDSAIGTIYNTNGTYSSGTTQVGSYAPNAWGLYDMHGNVWEWCLDWLSSSLPGRSITDPHGDATGSVKVRRGGSFDYQGSRCRAADRYYYPPSDYCSCIGFRVVLAPGE